MEKFYKDMERLKAQESLVDYKEVLNTCTDKQVEIFERALFRSMHSYGFIWEDVFKEYPKIVKKVKEKFCLDGAVRGVIDAYI